MSEYITEIMSILESGINLMSLETQQKKLMPRQKTKQNPHFCISIPKYMAIYLFCLPFINKKNNTFGGSSSYSRFQCAYEKIRHMLPPDKPTKACLKISFITMRQTSQAQAVTNYFYKSKTLHQNKII
jgi:hypothetical protein